MFKKLPTYLHAVTPPRPPLLQWLETYAAEQGFPIIGPLVGRFLFQVTRMIKARRILELGSGFGYSAFWFSLATGAGGDIILTDTDRENKRQALQYFRQAQLASRFDFRVGDALRILRCLEGPFDIILKDIDKEAYPDTIDPVADRLRRGGLFMTDNIIWSGRVTDKRPDAATRAIVEFTRRLYRDPRFFTTILPLRDGIALALRQ